MSKPFSFGRLQINLTANSDDSSRVPEPDTPFRIIILGDFGGRQNRGLLDPANPLEKRRPILVDRENFTQVMENLSAELHLCLTAAGGAGADISFDQLEDFHPDHLFESLEVFRPLRNIRRELDNPKTFESAAAEVKSWMLTGTEGSSETVQTDPVRSMNGEESGQISADFLLEGMEERRLTESQTADSWTAMLQEIVKPHTLPAENPQKTELTGVVDVVVGALMRKVLHHPDFQALEAAWRALHFLVRELETGPELQLYVLDISKAELEADLALSEDLQSTGIYRMLVEQTVGTPGAQPWALLIGNYSFGPTVEDVELVGRMAKIASRAGAPFLSAASPFVLGCESLVDTPDPDDWSTLSDSEDQAWNALRQLPEATYIGLALPRFLLRMPYGRETTSTEHFEFEEMDPRRDHESYLWGNPAFVCAYLLAETFIRSGWDFSSGELLDLEGLPVHIYQSAGESQIQPCAEVLLTERAADLILKHGLMPLLSIMGRDRVRLAQFQSLASRSPALAGRWR